jgi:hypothetical protein
MADFYETPQQPDKPKEAVEEVAETTQEGGTPDFFDEIFGIRENGFSVPVEENQGVPETQENVTGDQRQETAEQKAAREAEERSYRYWQSEADKRQNRIRELEEKLAREAQQRQLPPRDPNTGQFVPMQERGLPFQETGQPTSEVFPPPPARPKPPPGFSRAEAAADDRSPSAEYLNQIDDWNAQMAEYTADKLDYIEIQRITETERQKMEQMQQMQAAQARAAQQQGIREISKHLRDGYRFTDEQVVDFVQTMSNPNSITVDNLAKLYAMSKGIDIGAGGRQQSNQQVQPPSRDFLQQQRTQQVPNTMGVIPAQNGNVNGKDQIDLLVDDMVNISKRSSPW